MSRGYKRERGKRYRYAQEQVGIDAGIAEVLDMPLAFFFCIEDRLAELLRVAYHLSPERQDALVALAHRLQQSQEYIQKPSHGESDNTAGGHKVSGQRG